MRFSRRWPPTRCAPRLVPAASCRPKLSPGDRLALDPFPPACKQDLIKQATDFLKQASQQPGYGIMVLKARRRRRRRRRQPPFGCAATRRLAATCLRRMLAACWCTLHAA